MFMILAIFTDLTILVLKIIMIIFILISIPVIIYMYSFLSRTCKQLVHLQFVKLEYKKYLKDKHKLDIQDKRG